MPACPASPPPFKPACFASHPHKQPNLHAHPARSEAALAWLGADVAVFVGDFGEENVQVRPWATNS